jgi:hypothetical protein
MDLKKQSENISCNHINFLDKKYNLYNQLEFNKKMVPNSKDFTTNLHLNPSLNSHYISKKDCIYKSTEPYQAIFEKQFIQPSFNLNKPLFNANTKAKLNYDTDCP